MDTINHYVFATELGWTGIAVHQAKIKKIILPDASKKYVTKQLKQNYPKGKGIQAGLRKIIKSLQRYSSGQKESLAFPVDLGNSSAFARKVYQALKRIHYGKIRTYNWVARRIGNPRAARAVGNALAKNPVPLIIPCHRIIRHNGQIGNFSARGGSELKAKLLTLEKNTNDR